MFNLQTQVDQGLISARAVITVATFQLFIDARKENQNLKYWIQLAWTEVRKNNGEKRKNMFFILCLSNALQTPHPLYSWGKMSLNSSFDPSNIVPVCRAWPAEIHEHPPADISENRVIYLVLYCQEPQKFKYRLCMLLWFNVKTHVIISTGQSVGLAKKGDKRDTVQIFYKLHRWNNPAWTI